MAWLPDLLEAEENEPAVVVFRAEVGEPVREPIDADAFEALEVPTGELGVIVDLQ